MDFVLGYFIITLAPSADKRALGTRFTPDSLKQLKTGIQNLLKFFLKRKEKLEDFTFFMGLYVAKRNKYAIVPQESVQGDRKRKLIQPSDQELRDKFLAQPVEEVSEPEDLLLIVGTALLEADMGRGTSVLLQIRRSFISVKADEEGKHFVAVKGNLRRKTNNGNSSKFKPMNFKISSELEVKAIKKLLDTLPSVGCINCVHSTPPRAVGEDSKCVCDSLFLRQRELLHWRKTDKVWYARQAWSENKLDQLTASVSKKAGTAKVYTNGSIRPSNMTSLTMTGMSSDQLAHSFNLQKNHGQQEKYKRLGELMNDDQKRMATMVNTASGRNFLRGGINEFGSVQQKKSLQPNMYARFKGLMEDQGEDRVVSEEKEEGVGVEKENYDDNLEERAERDDVREGLEEVPSVVEKARDDTEVLQVGEKVFGKIYGFPPWPAELVDINPSNGKGTVVFIDGSVGRNATTLAFNRENFMKMVKTSKFKKTGSGSKARFLDDCKSLGMS